MRYKFLFIALLISNLVCGQVTFIVNQLPEGHDFNKSLYISGNFEGWSGGSEETVLSQDGETYSITLNNIQCNILFKFTLGSWESVETDGDGASIENRSYTCESGEQTVYISIEGWTGDSKAIVRSTAHQNVTILSNDFEMPQLDRSRKIRLYLPPDYKTSNKNYPVLYIQDGQNVFDVKTSYAGEWEVDETLNHLYYEMGLSMIVVAIDNAEDQRVNEYIPYTFPRIEKSEGQDYSRFLVETLKPYIDKNFRTMPDAENTAIMGSSLGGLISHYAALENPNVFGKVGVFSPSFWVSQEAYDLARKKSNQSNMRMYFLAGDREGERVVPDVEKMIDVMKDSGFKNSNIYKKIIEGGQHNEKLWRENFEAAILWLFDLNKPIREYKNMNQKEGEVEIEVSDGTYFLKFLSPKIVESTFVPTGQELIEKSHAVQLISKDVIQTITENDNGLIIESSGIDINIQKSPFKINYYYNDQSIIAEKKGYHRTEFGEAISLQITKDEVLYGGGARALGMNRRGHKLRLYNRAHYGYETESPLMNFTIPVAISSKKYMVHFDNAPIGFLDLDSQANNTMTYETISGRKSYQIVVGESWEDLLDNYTELTGKQPMLPRWALGNFSSRFGYHSQAETENTIKRFKDEQIPVDAIILDLYWFGKEVQGTMGNLAVYRDSFPDFEGMVDRLKQKGVKTIPITEPFILSTSKRWDEAVDQQILATDSTGQPARYDFYFGNTGIIDIYKKEAEDWFWNIYKGLADMGVSGVWGDLGEPEVHPSWVQHHTGTADELHNIYGHDWARLVYEGYARDFPEERPFILMRAGYSGSQRYGMIPWSGDVNRTWGGFQSQPEIALQMGMQGLAYMHSDLGGFAGANLDDELYKRWLQYGVFQPIYRPHAQEDVPSEPIFREPKTKASAKKAIELRYKLLPYNYNLVFENNQKGLPLMRPLFFEDESDATYNMTSTYLWGNDFLVTPVINPDTDEIDVYFPKNNNWFDFYSDTLIEGGQTLTVAMTSESIPTYVRAGAFIPITSVVQSTDNYALNTFELHYYHHDTIAQSERQLYNDDGWTKNAFEKGQYEILKFEFEQQDKTFEIELEAKNGSSFSSVTKMITVFIHNLSNSPRQIKAGNKKIKSFNYNPETRILSFPLTWNTAKVYEIKMKF